MANMFSMIPGMGGGGGGGGNWWVTIAWIMLIVMLVVGFWVVFFFILYIKTRVRTFEIDQQNKRLRMFNGIVKRDKKKGTEKYYSKKLKKELPRPQQKDIFLKGKQDVVFFLKDNNGLHHTLRVPSYGEIKRYYKAVYNQDIATLKQEEVKPIYFIPNPHEDLEWLADQCLTSDEVFKWTSWWQHPNVLVLGAATICAFMFIMSMIVIKVM